jgi:hypothetical protein
MSRIIIGVVADVRRERQAYDLADSVKAQVLSYDDGAMGPTKNHLKVWTKLDQHGGDWSVVLEDDAEIDKDIFRSQLEGVLANPPADVVGLYLGTGYPVAWQRFIKKSTLAADAADANYIVSSHVLHGVGLAIRTHLVNDMLRFVGWMSAEERKWPIDEQITHWCRLRGYKTCYTYPSIVEHGDGPTLLVHPDGEGRTRPRKAWKYGNRETWDGTRTVEMP